MNDHEHDYFRTLAGALVCACGAPKEPIEPPKEQNT